jgi:hypothetical protein
MLFVFIGLVVSRVINYFKQHKDNENEITIIEQTEPSESVDSYDYNQFS